MTTNTVKIVKGAWDKNQKDNYQPAEVTVKEGSTMTWQNEDSVVHTMTSKQNSQFDSSMITAGQQWQHQFKEKGNYEYYCVIHPWMQAKVNVG